MLDSCKIFNLVGNQKAGKTTVFYEDFVSIVAS